jgi:predicted CoA-binding protein
MPIENDAEIRNILMRAKTIAVVGASDKPYRDSNRIAEFLMRKGYTVYPVNPTYTETNGVRCYPDLASLPGPVDIVDVFRNPDAVDDVVSQSIAANAGTLWLQSGVIHEGAARRAEAAGIAVIMDHCIAVEYGRLVR